MKIKSDFLESLLTNEKVKIEKLDVDIIYNENGRSINECLLNVLKQKKK